MAPWNGGSVVGQSMLVFALGLGLALAVGPGDAGAAGADDLAKQVDKDLRNAERLMFNGKKQEAFDMLGPIAEKIEQIKGADSNNGKIKTLEGEYTNLKGDLERKMGTAAPATARPTTLPPKPAAKASAPAPQQAVAPDEPAGLSAGILAKIEEVDGILTKVPDPVTAENLAQAEQYLGQAEDEIDRIGRIYGKQVTGEEPEMVAVKDRIAAAHGRVDPVKAEAAKAAAAAAAQKAAKIAQAAEDGKKVEELYQKYYSRLDSIHGNSMVYGRKPADIRKALTELDNAEKETLAAIQPVLVKLAEKYGETATDIDNSLYEWGVPSSDRFGTHMGRLIEGMGNVAKSRAASAETVATEARQDLGNVDLLIPEIRVKNMAEIKERLLLGQKLDPNNKAINELLADIDQKIEAVAGKIEKDIDAAKWTDNVKDFAGPGDPKKLADEALKFFKEHPNWGKTDLHKVEVLKVSVLGDWRVAKRDILGRAIQWRLPVHVATTDERYKPKNIAKVWDLSVLAAEGPGDQAPQKPPFVWYWVGDNWMMRLNKL